MVAPILGEKVGGSQLENLKIEQQSITADTATVIATMDHHQTITHGEESNLKVLFTLKYESEPLGWRIHSMARQ